MKPIATLWLVYLFVHPAISRASDSTMERKYHFEELTDRLLDDVCYFDTHIRGLKNPALVEIWDFFVEHVTFGITEADSMQFVDIFNTGSAPTPFLLCMPYYREEQQDAVSLSMYDAGEAGSYIPIQRTNEMGIDLILLNYLFGGMDSYALRMNTLFHEAIHFWVQYHYELPTSIKKARIIHETFAYTLSWEVTVTLLPGTVDSLFSELVRELDRNNMPEYYYGARLPGVDAECLSYEIQLASAGIFTAEYVTSIAELLLENENGLSRTWYRKKFKILKQGNLI